ncbi:Probable gamma-secretase subunit PEN-2 [Linum perenne]
METSHPNSSASSSSATNPMPIPNPTGNSILASAPVWPTIDGPLGLTEEESLTYARRFYGFGYALLPWLWAVNCFYFWPVLCHSRSFPLIRPYILFITDCSDQ